MRRTIVVLALVGALAATFSARAPSAPSSSSLVLTALMFTNGLGVTTCPPGPAMECFDQMASTAVRGLGTTTLHSMLFMDTGQGSCPPGRLYGTLTAGADSVTFSGTSNCVPANGSATFNYSFTGGSGAFSGASGGGLLSYSFADSGGRYNWGGTLTVPGYSFDTTPPVFSGIHGKTVHARKHAMRTRVTYAVTARDDVDGSVPVSCHPAAGAWFHLGRTTVRCYATDAHANEAQASFLVIVKQAR